MSRYAVVGSGPAGAAAAHALAAAGHDVVVLEQADRIGGRTIGWDAPDATVDSGAGFFTNFYPVLDGLLDELGLREEIITLDRSNALVRDSEIASLSLGSVGSFLRFPFVGPAGKARMARATVAASLRRRGLDLNDPASLAATDDRSVAAHARATVGEQAYENLVRPSIEPFWYISCEDVSRSMFLALQARAATARFYTLRPGMQAIAERLCAGPGIEVRTAQRVDRIARDGTGVIADGERFDGIVVATTSSAAARIVDPALLSAELREHLASQQYVPQVHASFRVAHEACPPQSALFPAGPGHHSVAAIAFNSHKRQGTHQDGELVSVFLSARVSADLVDSDPATIYQHAWRLGRELCPTLPLVAEPFAHVARREAIPVHAVGRYRTVAQALTTQAAPLVLAGDHLATATIDGALSSGQRAARALLLERSPKATAG
ncbi:hypothetical protein C6I20_12995 [Aeromicrobium sp. A1-2]|uniref:protoporphyrinogen/coproporphyrinogen oxidase n=1 Tax=Aeromicrobium sp. A1-2 TaxID=2107713 RepID=UPI000E492A9F|nr:FAD-dependent oxidoreductase [Aeromicrobium sp. A1-2]AXT86009.1 hypothetical protein C6I20_12995 [Aeromicrobium sp. A1-2]